MEITVVVMPVLVTVADASIGAGSDASSGEGGDDRGDNVEDT